MNITPSLIAAAALAAAGATFAIPANAANATQQACSSQYQAAKTAGTLNGQKWSDFYSSCTAAMKSGAAAATPAPTAAAPAVATAAPAKMPKTVKTASAAPATASPGGQSTQQLCSAQYQAAKTAGTLNGQKWPAFYSSCAANIKNYQEPAAAPALPAVAAAPAKGAPPTQTANYQPPANLSAGEAAFQQRIHACAAEWQSEKTAGTLPAGSKWPQFWSACNTQLKAQG